MGMPADRVSGVVLVTDYGALDRALEQKRKQDEKKEEIVKNLNNLYTQDS